MPGQFLWDDLYWIDENSVVKFGHAPWDFWWTTDMADYLPLTATTFYLEKQLWGGPRADNPYPALPYRAVNLVFHALAAILIWRILLALEVPGAWLGAALFAVHPVGVASVAWVAELKNTLSLAPYALAFLAYLAFDRTGRWRYFSVAVLAFVLAMLAKQSVVVLPAVLVTLLWWRRRSLGKLRKILPLAFLALLALVGCAVSLWFHQSSRMNTRIDIGAPHGFFQRLFVACKALCFYAAKAVVPVRLNFIYPKWNMAQLDWTVLSIPAILAWITLLVVLRRRAWARTAAVVTACLIFSLAPVLGFLDMSYMRVSYVSDHLAYLALPVSMAALGGGIAALIRRWHKPMTIAAGLLILVFAALTAHRAWIFADNERLWSNVLAKNPDAWPAHNFLGVIIGKKGSGAERALYEQEAMWHFQRAIELRSDCTDAQANLAAALLRRHQLPEALEHYKVAVDCQPKNPDWQYGYGGTLVQMGRSAEAIDYLQSACRNRPKWADPHFQLAQAYAKLDQPSRAAEEYRQTINLRPGYPPAIKNLAWLLATSDDDAVRNGPQAVALAQQALQLSWPDKSGLYATLAAAYAEAGHPDDAVAAAQQAQALALKQGQTKQAADLERLIPYYRQGKTYRDIQKK